MQEEAGQPTSYADLEKALSLERFGRYLDWADGDRSRAIDLYTLNTAISESLYTPLQTLEIALRNRIHAAMSEARHATWLQDEGMLLGEWQPEQLAKAVEDIEAAKKQPVPSRIVAALTLSFWTSMFGKNYETLWQTTLHKIAHRPDGKGLRRKDFSGPLTPIRSLRNRVAHHEPIIMWNLPKRYASMLELIGWLSPPAAEWCKAHSRFELVCPAERIILHTPAEAKTEPRQSNSKKS